LKWTACVHFIGKNYEIKNAIVQIMAKNLRRKTKREQNVLTVVGRKEGVDVEMNEFVSVVARLERR
jgi:hypothetical protein